MIATKTLYTLQYEENRKK